MSPQIVSSVALLLLASACSMTPSPMAKVERPPIPANLITPCPSLSPLLEATFPMLAGKIVDVSGKYYECKAKHEALVKAVEGMK